MAFNYSPKIVTDGLVLYLDVANPRSYVSGSTAWNDISRQGNNGTLINGPTFSGANGGSIVFDGVDDFAGFSNIFNSLNQISVNFWIKNPNDNVIITKGYRYWEIRFSGNEFGGYVGQNNGSTFWYGIADNNNILHGTDLTQWNNFTYVFDYTNTNIKLYANAALKGSINVLNMYSTYSPTYDLNIGRRVEFNNAFLSANLSIVQIYNRLLSATEILQNYNATKTRFGLI